MSNEAAPINPDPKARAEAWAADRQTEVMPLPGSDVSHYRSESERQAALAAAEKSNVAKAAGELGMTSDEWMAKRAQLGRSPTARDK